LINSYALPLASWTAQSRRRFAVAESLVITIWPWPVLAFEVAATDAILGFPEGIEARLPRAIWWAFHQCFGGDGGEAFNTFFPNAARPVRDDEWTAISGVAPVTLDETAIGRIIALLEAARRLLIDEPLAERSQFRRDLVEAATGMRPLWADWIDAARQQEDGLVLVDLTSGWFRVEDPEASAALKRVLRRNACRS
jgi:hypothetical protein